MFKVAVCDDDNKILLYEKKLLEEYENGQMQIHTFNSGEELLENFQIFELIILDIDMQGINGIETAKRIREKDSQVKLMYVTNYCDYSLFAFSVHAFSYLLKPLEKESFYKQLDEVFLYIKQENKIPEELEFNTDTGLLRISVNDILYFEYENRKVRIKTKDKEYYISVKIGDLQKRLSVENFAVPHKSFIVNLYNVKSIKNYDINIINGDLIPLSQKKSVEFRKKLNKYLSDTVSIGGVK